MQENKTVAAVATPNSAGGIGIVRISGADALKIADSVFRAASGKSLCSSEGYRAHYGTITDSDESIDEGIALVFRAPKSYTGEDVVELSCHGGLYITKRTLRAVLRAGALPAPAGEFTKRAFLNGRIDLAEAESVMALIGAQGEQAAAAAYNTLEGKLSSKISEIAHSLISVCAHMSAWVDYPDEEIEEISENQLKSVFNSAAQELSELLRSFENGRAVTQGVDAVIAGRPNVGKSTLMNLLSGYERSIVTDIPGTTRDVVEESVKIGDILLRLADTAGIRSAQNEVESIGVSLAKKRMRRAQLVIAVFDGSQALSDEDKKILSDCADKLTLAVINKSDLEQNVDMEYIKQHADDTVLICAKTGEGCKAFENALSKLLGTADFDPSAAVLTTERQRLCCEKALENLNEALRAIDSGVTLDAVNVCADCAVEALLELTGEKAGEAVVNEVFSQFCVGK